MVAHALIFDLDGTVWDSAPWFATGLARDPEIVERLGTTLRATGNIVREIDAAGLNRERFLREAERVSGPPPLFPGMRKALEAAADRGVRVAVATSLPGTIALPMIDMAGLAGRFETVIHAGVCRAAKPSPASIKMTLRGLGVGPGVAVYVGDRASDAEAARRAGMVMAWVAHGYEAPIVGDHVRIVEAEGIAEL